MGVFVRANKTPVTASAAPIPVAFTGRRAVAAAYGAERAITASAKKLDKTTFETLSTQSRSYRQWQKDAWTGYERIGEIHFGFNLVANIFSRLRIYGAVIVGADAAPAPLAQAQKDGDISADLADKVEKLMSDFMPADFSSQARTFALNLSVPGECLLLQLPPEADGQAGAWVIRSTDEILVEPDKIRLLPSRDARGSSAATKDQVLAQMKGGEWNNNINIGRIWRKHPRYTDEPDSSMAAVADSIEELLLVSRMIRSATRSRLNAGLLFVPDGINTAGGASSPEEPAVDEFGNAVTEPAVEDANSFMADLMESMVTPITDEAAASSVVPMVVTGQGELGKQITHMTFERKSDDWLAGRADKALERILQGIDVPKDVVTGLADVKYSNAIQIDENLYKANIEPLALTFVDALTDIYLRPALRELGVSEDDANKVCIWYDPAEIVTRPNQSEDANQGFDKNLLSGATWRRMHGFTETDAPDENELATKILMDKAQLPEDITQALLQFVFPTILGKKRAENIANEPVPMPQSAQDILNGGLPTSPTS